MFFCVKKHSAHSHTAVQCQSSLNATTIVECHSLHSRRTLFIICVTLTFCLFDVSATVKKYVNTIFLDLFYEKKDFSGQNSEHFNYTMDNSDTGEYLIKKEIIHPGKAFIPFVDGTRVN